LFYFFGSFCHNDKFLSPEAQNETDYCKIDNNIATINHDVLPALLLKQSNGRKYGGCPTKAGKEPRCYAPLPIGFGVSSPFLGQL